MHIGRLILFAGWMCLLLSPTAGAQEQLIHFDCIASPSDGLGSVPRSDPFNNPPNNLQCLPTMASVLGPGTVHPNLEIRSPDGHTVAKIQAGMPNYGTFGAPQATTINNNCLEFLQKGRVQVQSGALGAFGFGDRTACGGGTSGCDPLTPDPVQLDFIFHGLTVRSFSVRMLDWGDYNPERREHQQVTLTAYNQDGEIVARYNYDYTITQIASPNGHGDENPGAYVCNRGAENACLEGTDLWFDGDACTAADGWPGYVELTVVGKSIAMVELRVPSAGFDSNLGFDSIRFTPTRDGPLPGPRFIASRSSSDLPWCPETRSTPDSVDSRRILYPWLPGETGCAGSFPSVGGPSLP